MIFSNRRHTEDVSVACVWLTELVTLRSPMIAAVLAALPSVALAQEEGSEPTEIIVLEEVMCKELMGQAGDDRDRSISFLHGFVLGDLGQNVVNLEEIIAIEDVFFEACLDNPTASALAMMKSAYGVSDE